jgi:hypothetical protein
VGAPGAIDCDLAEPALAETKAILEQMGRGGSAPMRCCGAVVTNIGATGAPKVAWVMERMRGLYQFRRRRLKARGRYLADDGSQDRSLPTSGWSASCWRRGGARSCGCGTGVRSATR